MKTPRLRFLSAFLSAWPQHNYDALSLFIFPAASAAEMHVAGRQKKREARRRAALRDSPERYKHCAIIKTYVAGSAILYQIFISRYILIIGEDHNY